MSDVVQSLQDLIQMKKSGELSADEFAAAKKIALNELFEANEAAADPKKSGAAEDGSRVRRRSVKDWMLRINQDSDNTVKGANTDQTGIRTQKMFGVWGAATTPEYIGGETPEDKASGVEACLKAFFADGSHLQLTATDADGVGFKGEAEKNSKIFGKWFKDDGTWQKFWEFNFRNIEWNLDIQNAKIVTTGNCMSVDYGWTNVQSLKSKKYYECYIKSDCGYTDDLAKITFQKWTLECGGANLIQLYKDDGFECPGVPAQNSGVGTMNARSNGKDYAE